MKIAFAVSLLALTIAACGSRVADSDRVLLTQFFAACRLRDLTAARNFATVVFEPARDGIITSFEITGVSAAGATGEIVAIDAPVRLPDGRMVVKHLAVTIQNGLITAISERPAPASTPRS